MSYKDLCNVLLYYEAIHCEIMLNVRHALVLLFFRKASISLIFKMNNAFLGNNLGSSMGTRDEGEEGSDLDLGFFGSSWVRRLYEII